VRLHVRGTLPFSIEVHTSVLRVPKQMVVSRQLYHRSSLSHQPRFAPKSVKSHTPSHIYILPILPTKLRIMQTRVASKQASKSRTSTTFNYLTCKVSSSLQHQFRRKATYSYSHSYQQFYLGTFQSIATKPAAGGKKVVGAKSPEPWHGMAAASPTPTTVKLYIRRSLFLLL